jgi:hypothetical protein
MAGGRFDSAPTHAVIDRLAAAGTGLAALATLLAGHVAGAVILVLLALAMAALILMTRYRAEPTQRATTAIWDTRRQGGAGG